MGSFARKHRRDVQRKTAGISNEQADKLASAIRENTVAKKKAVENAVKEMAPEILEKTQDIVRPRVYAEALMILCWTMDGYGWGKQRIENLLLDFNEMADILHEDNMTLEDMTEALKEEKGLDLLKVFDKMSEESAKASRQRRKAASNFKRWKKSEAGREMLQGMQDDEVH